MLIETQRFGQVEVDDSKILHFREGLLGFAGRQRYALLQTNADPVFYWLQAVDDPALAFVVCDPLAFVPDYQVPIRKDDLEALGLTDVGEAQVLVIVNKVNGTLTGNLLGPLVVATNSLQARQLVLSDKRYGTRHPLVPVTKTAAAVRSA